MESCTSIFRFNLELGRFEIKSLSKEYYLHTLLPRIVACGYTKLSRPRNTNAHTEPRCPLHPRVRFKEKCQGWNFHLAKKCHAQGIPSRWEGDNVGITWSDLEMLWEMKRSNRDKHRSSRRDHTRTGRNSHDL